jgi:hypothetical protein
MAVKKTNHSIEEEEEEESGEIMRL